jgi:cytochrome c
MKKTIFLLTVLSILAACGGGGADKKPKVVDITQTDEYKKGYEVVKGSDCMTCHLIDEKNVGPAWRDVANKYAGQDTAVRYLAHKIINGGSGVWGNIPMASHATFTQEQAEAVAKYVLLLKNK